jgi:hypothetical protein
MQIQTASPHNESLMWSRPVFYEPNHSVEPYKIIIAPHNTLPSSPLKKLLSLIICIGAPPAEWIDGRRSVVVIKNNKTNPYTVFNIIQTLFDRYDAWEEDLQKISAADADVRKMLERSIEIFDNQILVSDRNLKILAANILPPPGEESGSEQWLIKSGSPIPFDIMEKARKLYKSGERLSEPQLLNLKVISGEDMWVYRVPLFFSNQYQGNIALCAVKHTFRPGELALLRKFSEYIKEALHKHAIMGIDASISPRALIKNLLNYLPVDKHRLYNALELEFDKVNYWVGMKVVFNESEKNMPPGDYLCATFEEVLPASIAVVHESEIVLFVQVKNDDTGIDNILSIIEPLLTGMDFQIGVSNVFYDITRARIHYMQAGCALTTGRELFPKNKVYKFENFVLPYMLSHCRGQFAVEDLISNRLQKLKKLNRTSSVDYWHTLRVYLDNNLNTTKTARDLFLHRSSLLQRLSRIHKIMGASLNDRREQLYIKLYMYMTEYASLSVDK